MELEFELSGDGKMVAHVDGDEFAVISPYATGDLSITGRLGEFFEPDLDRAKAEIRRRFNERVVEDW